MNKKKSKAKKWINEFKTFALRGSVVDMAIGVIIGGAFQKIISSVIDDIIMPFVGLVTGGINFNDQFAILRNDSDVASSAIKTLEQAKAIGGVTTFNYGSFITTVINFFIMALVVFAFVRFVNKVRDMDPSRAKQEKAEEQPTTKICPYCKSEIDIEATKCPRCTSDL